MKKLFFALIALIAVAGIAIFMNLGSLAKAAIETAGSRATGTDVKVSGLDVSLSSRQAKMRGLSVANPAGFKEASLIKTKGIDVTLGDIAADVVIIKEVVVDGMAVTYELGQNGTNFDAIMKNLKGASASSKAETAAKPEASTAPKVIVQKLRIVNAELIPSLGIVSAPVKLPEITLTNIGSKSKPATAVDVAVQVLNKVLTVSAKAALKAGIINSLTGGAAGALGVIVPDAAEGLLNQFKVNN